MSVQLRGRVEMFLDDVLVLRIPNALVERPPRPGVGLVRSVDVSFPLAAMPSPVQQAQWEESEQWVVVEVQDLPHVEQEPYGPSDYICQGIAVRAMTTEEAAVVQQQRQDWKQARQAARQAKREAAQQLSSES